MGSMERTPPALDTIGLHWDGPVCWATLDRPSTGNALNPHVLDELDSLLAYLAGDRATKVLVLRGSGHGFCSGHELGRDRGADDVVSVVGRMHRSFETFRRIWEFPKPVIAAVHGYCVGAATQLCACCDLVAVATDAQIGLPRLPMGAGLTPPLLALTVGVRRAKQMAFEIGSTMDGRTAVDWGWANICAESDELWEAVGAWAQRISRAPLDVLAGQKASINRVANIQGFWSAATIGIEMDALHHYARTGAATSAAIREVGVKGAIEQFRQGRLGGESA